MEQVIYNILTDETERDPDAIAASLAAQTQAGAPWFDAIGDTAVPQND